MWEQQQARVNTSWMELNGRSRVFSLVLLYFRFFLLSFNIWFYYFIRYEWTKLGGMASTNTRIANIPNKTEIMFFKWIPTCAMIYIPIDCYCQQQQQNTHTQYAEHANDCTKMQSAPDGRHRCTTILFYLFILFFVFFLYAYGKCLRCSMVIFLLRPKIIVHSAQYGSVQSRVLANKIKNQKQCVTIPWSQW